MKKIVVVLVSFVVAILVIGGNAFAQNETSNIPEPSLGPEWKFVAIDPDGTTVYVNTRSITHLPKGIVKVRELWVPRGELRRKLVNDLKKDLLSEGRDPNNAERFWYNTSSLKFNCRTHQVAPLGTTAYSFGQSVLIHEPFQHEKWGRFSPGSLDDIVEKYVCNEAPPSIPAQYKQSIPNPPLGPEWKVVFTGSNGTTVYVNTRSITHLPKGIVKVRWLLVPRGEFKRTLAVNVLKHTLLSEGKDPNNAEKLWYYIQLEKVNCKKHKSATLELDAYSFRQVPLDSHSFQHEEWDRIIPGSIGEDIERYVCKEHKEKK